MTTIKIAVKDIKYSRYKSGRIFRFLRHKLTTISNCSGLPENCSDVPKIAAIVEVKFNVVYDMATVGAIFFATFVIIAAVVNCNLLQVSF